MIRDPERLPDLKLFSNYEIARMWEFFGFTLDFEVFDVSPQVDKFDEILSQEHRNRNIVIPPSPEEINLSSFSDEALQQLCRFLNWDLDFNIYHISPQIQELNNNIGLELERRGFNPQQIID